jgi:hypothetical protein
MARYIDRRYGSFRYGETEAQSFARIRWRAFARIVATFVRRG